MTDLYNPKPPPLAVPLSPVELVRVIVDLAFVQNHRPTKAENNEKRIIIEEVNKRIKLSVTRWPCFTKLIKYQELGSVPWLLTR